MKVDAIAKVSVGKMTCKLLCYHQNYGAAKVAFLMKWKCMHGINFDFHHSFCPFSFSTPTHMCRWNKYVRLTMNRITHGKRHPMNETFALCAGYCVVLSALRFLATSSPRDFSARNALISFCCLSFVVEQGFNLLCILNSEALHDT